MSPRAYSPWIRTRGLLVANSEENKLSKAPQSLSYFQGAVNWQTWQTGVSALFALATDQLETSGTKRTARWAASLHDFDLSFSRTWRRTPGSWTSRRYVTQSIAAGSKKNSRWSSFGSDRNNWRVLSVWKRQSSPQ